MAVGKAGNPRKAGVDGEIPHAAKIAHRLLDPDEFSNQHILIYGGGDVALEAALALCDDNHVTLATIDKEFVYPKRRNVEALKAKEAEGKVTIHMDSWLKSVGEKDVTFTKGKGGDPTTIENEFLFEMIGAELPTPFFKKVGIKLENEWDGKALGLPRFLLRVRLRAVLAQELRQAVDRLAVQRVDRAAVLRRCAARDLLGGVCAVRMAVQCRSQRAACLPIAATCRATCTAPSTPP